jgi:hypothetical protein
MRNLGIGGCLPMRNAPGLGVFSRRARSDLGPSEAWTETGSTGHRGSAGGSGRNERKL